MKFMDWLVSGSAIVWLITDIGLKWGWFCG